MWDSPDAAKLFDVCAAVSNNDLTAVRALHSNENTAQQMLAIRRKDVSLCPLSYAGGAASPDSRCVADVAVAKKERATCATVKRANKASVPYDMCIMAAANGDTGACALLTNDTPAQQILTRKLCATAAKTKCPDTGLQDCVVHFMMGATDETLCNLAPGFPDQTCLLTVAFNTRKRAACAGLMQPDMKTACDALTGP
jgi:hypothetical protein